VPIVDSQEVGRRISATTRPSTARIGYPIPVVPASHTCPVANPLCIYDYSGA
jgi:hypothetical protein